MITGVVTNTNYGSIVNNGGDAELKVNSFSDFFQWQFDFYKETRQGIPIK